MEKVEIVDTVEEVLEEHDNIGDAIMNVTDVVIFIEGYDEGFGMGLAVGGCLAAVAWAGYLLVNNRNVILSTAKGMFKKGDKNVTEVK